MLVGFVGVSNAQLIDEKDVTVTFGFTTCSAVRYDYCESVGVCIR